MRLERSSSGKAQDEQAVDVFRAQVAALTLPSSSLPSYQRFVASATVEGLLRDIRWQGCSTPWPSLQPGHLCLRQICPLDSA